jgi:hypothetical protein
MTCKTLSAKAGMPMPIAKHAATYAVRECDIFGLGRIAFIGLFEAV